ncbi:hypothetical protein VNO77_33154 [Canavalia gladiata]|uniref:Uncharacterized protein n=1 Tax=Canavalia gladiata TaxID=3824 RepID=A0AAN9PY38_CANGL
MKNEEVLTLSAFSIVHSSYSLDVFCVCVRESISDLASSFVLPLFYVIEHLILLVCDGVSFFMVMNESVLQGSCMVLMVS